MARKDGSMVEWLDLGDRGELYHTYLEEFIPYSEAIANIHLGAVAKHAASGFEPLPFDLSLHPYQRADCVSIMGQAGSVEDVREMAPFVFKGFDRAVRHVKRERRPLLETMEEGLLSGNPVEYNIASDHRNVLATAVAPHVFGTAILERGNVPQGSFYYEITISDMIKFTRFLGTPTVELMQKFYDAIRTVSPSNSQSRSQFPPNYAQRKNEAVTETRALFVAKSRIVGVSPSATSDIEHIPKPENKHGLLRRGPKPEPDTYVMCPPSDGTLREYVIGKNVIPCGVDFRVNGGAYYFADRLFDSGLYGDDAPPHVLREVGIDLMQVIATGISRAAVRAKGLPSRVASSVEEYHRLRK